MAISEVVAFRVRNLLRVAAGEVRSPMDYYAEFGIRIVAGGQRASPGT